MKRTRRGWGMSARILAVTAVVAAGAFVAAPAASAATTAPVIATIGLNVRSAPSTGAKVVGAVPYKGVVTITCTARGTAVTGPGGSTTLWDYITYKGVKGYVTDAWVNTGTSKPVAAACSSSSVGQRVAAYAKTQVGKTGYNGFCEMWVEQMWQANVKYPSAIAHYNAVRSKISRTGTPPAGALVFYAAAPINSSWGHVMISLGNGQYVTTSTTIRIVNQTWPGAPYLGWYMPTWKGR